MANFSDNKITSTEGIAHPLLEKLILSCTLIKMYHTVLFITNAIIIWCHLFLANQITEISGLTRRNLPSLRMLDLHSNQITSTDNISIPTLRQLFLASNNITAVEGLDGVPQLTILHLRENQIMKLDGFTEQLESLQYINLRYSQIN